MRDKRKGKTIEIPDDADVRAGPAAGPHGGAQGGARGGDEVTAASRARAVRLSRHAARSAHRLLAGLAAMTRGRAPGCRPPATRSPTPSCAPTRSRGVVNCGPGNNRKPARRRRQGAPPRRAELASRRRRARGRRCRGILWQVVEDSRTPRTKAGGPLNDELLGHHGTDRLSGRGGHDILWGDWDPMSNNTAQRDVLDGGPGNDWLYPSHGRSVVKGGPGIDYVWAYYGKGTIDCGPGIDTARIRTNGAFKTTQLRADPPLLRARREQARASASRRPASRSRRRAGAVADPPPRARRARPNMIGAPAGTYDRACILAAKKIRVVVAKPGLDGHDRGAKIIARALRDAGMEVIYTGLHQTPEQIVETVIQEDAQAVGLSVLSGAHMTLVPRIVALLEEQGIDDVVVIVGGTIPGDDIPELKRLGVAEVFGPGSSTEAIVDFIRGAVAAA